MNLLADPFREQDKLASQDPAKKSNIKSDKASSLLEAPFPTLILLPIKDFFTKFMKVFIELTKA